MLGSFFVYSITFIWAILFFEFGRFMSVRKRPIVAIICLVVSFLLPLLLAGFRCVGIDYKGYISIYQDIGNQSIAEYIRTPNSYVEFGYYLINRFSYLLFNNYIAVFLISSFLTLFFIYLSLWKYKNLKYLWVGLYIFYMTLYSYSLNLVRFSISIAICCYAFTYLIKKNYLLYILYIFIATLFHKTALICLPFILLVHITNNKINKIRNMLFYTAVLFSPWILIILLKITANISIFQRYYDKYEVNFNNWGLGFLQYIIPILPLVIIYKRKLCTITKNFEVFFNIALLQIPFLFLGYFSKQASRLDGYSTIVYIIIIPQILSNIKSRRNRHMVFTYYLIWYLVYYYFNYIFMGLQGVYPYASTFFSK